jgi:hypothetical protein
MRLLKIAIINSVLLIGCHFSTSDEEVKQLEYYKDTRTGLCFVENVTYYGYDVFANVPCTPEVERLIKQ